ncbi:hypothetical protein [Mycobacterium sp.]|uniref:hypothetical protein n=1 Tax=Mycobacterium sp. TaxID=1785 RepID=UPI002BACDAC2|nr:hypothetical protein [Mycobacterium sp.]HKP42919.1 hypothetical protein [Mycobacterium sp.]
MHAKAFVIGTLAVALPLAPIASADPVVPQEDAPCTADLAGVMTWPQGAKMPLVCANRQWQEVTTPQPPSDRWLSFDPPMLLHGEGMRNPSVKSGDWTATPQDPNAQCRAEQQTVVGPGVLGAPQVAEGKPGQPLEVQLLPRLFSIQLSGYCEWARQD